MTPFQRALQKAVELRAIALGDQTDEPVRSVDVISRVKQRYGIKEIPVQPNDQLLRNADAVLFSNQRWVAVRNDVEPGVRAFLVGHEVGHLDLHSIDGVGCHTIAAAALDSATAESFAKTKVEAYGARERAELQANVFAKELLFPRKLACRLFLEGGKSASTIASELDLPQELVRQQMLDALLLPPPKQDSDVDKELEVVTEQQKAAKSTARVSLVMAGPGTGKTATLTQRVQHLIQSGIKPEQILVLTFTNKAARELVDRLKGSSSVSAQMPWAGTFHAFGLEFLRRYHQDFGLKPDFQVLDIYSQVALLESLLDTMRLNTSSPFSDASRWLKDVVSAISRVKEELLDTKAYRLACEADSTSDESIKRNREDVANLFEAYQKAITRAGYVDFTDLVAIPAKALEQNWERYRDFVEQFKHILIDEYQDVNRASGILVRALAKTSESLWVVGDPRQAIFRFRGASLRNLTGFGDDHGEYQKYSLTKSRRSSKEIVDLVNASVILNPINKRYTFAPLQSKHGKCGDIPALLRCRGAESQWETLRREIIAANQAGIPYGDQAVVVNRNATAQQAANELKKRGIPVLYIGNIFERVEVRELLSLLSLTWDHTASSLVGLSGHKKLGLTKRDLESVIRHAKASTQNGSWWLKLIPLGLEGPGRTKYVYLQEILTGVYSQRGAWDALCDLLLERGDLLRRLSALTGIEGIVSRVAVWQFVHFARAADGIGANNSVAALLAKIRRRVRLGDLGEIRSLPPEVEDLDAVAVITVHGSKGLEFEAVHLLECTSETFDETRPESPLVPESLTVSGVLQGTNQDATVERLNLLYVALSRAKRRLRLYCTSFGRNDSSLPAGITKASGVWRSLQALDGNIQSQNVATAPSTSVTVLNIDASTLPVYYKCPRRYYYSFVLGLSPRGDLPPFLSAERAVISALAEIGTDPTLLTKPGPEEVLAACWERAGLLDAPREVELSRWAQHRFVRGLAHLREPNTVPATEFPVAIDGTTIRVRPHQLVQTGSSVLLLRFFRHYTYSAKSKEKQMLDGLLGLIQAANPSLSVRMEVVPLDAILNTTVSTSAWSQNRLLEVVRDIRNGKFPTRNSDYGCNRCRHYFYCPEVPRDTALHPANRPV